tara:strand:- start:103 stop:594 length:492 start_codon:yes stop_codon:yes gene_type:complete
MKKLTLLLLSAALSTLALADPPEYDRKSLRLATEANARELVEIYYDKAAVGLSDRDLNVFYSQKYRRFLSELVAQLAQTTGQGTAIEQHRVLELERMNAKCESLTFQNAKTYGSQPRQSELHYLVTNSCVDYLPTIARTIELRYSTDIDSWQIDEVRDRELVE